MSRLTDIALDCGADKAAVITRDRIILSDTFRGICETGGCGAYGRCWVCPPDAGDIHELMDRVRSYPGAVVYQSIHAVEDSFDIEGMGEAGKRHAQLCQRIETRLREEGYKGYFHLSAGGCRLCEKCTRTENLPCRYPDRALISMEACGVDVYQTVKDTDLKYINGQNTVTFFGMILTDGEAKEDTNFR